MSPYDWQFIYASAHISTEEFCQLYHSYETSLIPTPHGECVQQSIREDGVAKEIMLPKIPLSIYVDDSFAFASSLLLQNA